MNLTLRYRMQRFERRVIRCALRRCNGNVAATARSLGITRPTLYERIDRLELQAERSKPAP